MWKCSLKNDTLIILVKTTIDFSFYLTYTFFFGSFSTWTDPIIGELLGRN